MTIKDWPLSDALRAAAEAIENKDQNIVSVDVFFSPTEHYWCVQIETED